MSKKETKSEKIYTSKNKRTNKNTKKSKNKNINNCIFKNINKPFNILIKLLLIVLIISGFWYVINDSYSNKISLLAVSENARGEIVSGSLIDLNLRVKLGKGQVFVQLNSLEEIDTQISIVNSQKIACNLFDLDCNNYDFYYSFDGSSLILKGPSASSAIAILTAKTLNNEKIDDYVAITGSLNSGGIIGNVGGIDEKVQLAQKNGFKKVLIPVFSTFNETKANNLQGIQVIKVLDIIEAYNQFDGKKYQFKGSSYDKTKYSLMMRNLSENLCKRSYELQSKINLTKIDNTSSLITFKIQAQKSLNSSIIASENENFYAMGSFCYNTNLNYRVIYETQKNSSFKEIEKQILDLKMELNSNYKNFNSKKFKSEILTRNDLYAYLIMMDRIEEAREFINNKNVKTHLEIEKDYNLTITAQKNYTNITINNPINTTPNNSSNNSINIKNTTIILTNNTPINLTINSTRNLFSMDFEKILTQNLNKNIRSYSFSKERYYTVELWEDFINHQGGKIKFNDKTINEACIKINNDIFIKNELLKNYGFNLFSDLVEKQKELSTFGNKYVCVYGGLELSGKIDTVLNSFGISSTNQKNYTLQVLEIVDSRLGYNSNGDFPLISYIYAEYSHDLLKQDDLSSSMLYSNYALSYANLDLYLEKEIDKKSFIQAASYDFFKMDTMSILFIFGIMFLMAFL